MKPLVVFDMDGVLANNDHRARFLDQDEPDWKSFYSNKEVAQDLPVKPIIALYKHLCEVAEVQIWSGRQQSSLLISRQWLMKHAGVLPVKFCFRANDDRSTNLDLKRKFLQQSSRKPSMVFDSQPNTAEFWHKRGIQVLYCAHP